jgi:hypothetical protein
MTSRKWGLVLLLIGSLAIGILVGEMFHRLFLSTVPPAVLSGFNRGATHAAHIFYGAVAGLVIFVWAVLAAGLAPLFGSRPAPKQN